MKSTPITGLSPAEHAAIRHIGFDLASGPDRTVCAVDISGLGPHIPAEHTAQRWFGPQAGERWVSASKHKSSRISACRWQQDDTANLEIRTDCLNATLALSADELRQVAALLLAAAIDIEQVPA